VLLDEPFAGIDPIALADLRLLIQHLKTRGVGVIITDHNVREALEIVDRAYIINDGLVLRQGTPAEIVDDEQVRQVYLGEKFAL
jgi:lipopolysaccharide export system ATP-binding protein